MINCYLIFIPCLCIPMVYQCWLLWDEFYNGFAPQIYHRQEPVADLPGVSLCLPFKYAFPEAYILDHINRSGADMKNQCALYAEYLRQENDSSQLMMTRLRNTYNACYTSHFLWADPADPLYLTNFTSLPLRKDDDRRDSLTIEYSQFARLYVHGDAGFVLPKITMLAVSPNVKSYDRYAGLCWTWFSRASRDWVDTAREVENRKQLEGDKGPTWWRTEDGDLVAGQILSRDHSVKWPYRLSSVRSISLMIDFLRVLEHWYGSPAMNLTALREHFTPYEPGELNFPIRVMVHSPYELNFNQPGVKGFRSSTWYGEFADYMEQTATVLDSAETSSYTKWQVTYTKTTLKHVSAPGRYSQYLADSSQQIPETMRGKNVRNTRRLSGCSQDDCRKLVTLIDQIENHAKDYPDEPVCIPSEATALGTSISDQLNSLSLDLPFCQPKTSSHVTFNDTEDLKGHNGRMLRVLKSHKPYQCPVDGKRIVLQFKTQIDGRLTLKNRTGFRPHDQEVTYTFNFRPDAVPELTIKYVHKMSTIELLANGCGLCGIWLGFSFLTALNWAARFVYQINLSHDNLIWLRDCSHYVYSKCRTAGQITANVVINSNTCNEVNTVRVIQRITRGPNRIRPESRPTVRTVRFQR